MQKNGKPSQILPLEAAIRYRVENRLYLVEPVYPAAGKEPLGKALLRLMELELTDSQM